jgi:tetratricopeptide (TPR) repeat protein
MSREAHNCFGPVNLELYVSGHVKKEGNLWNCGAALSDFMFCLSDVFLSSIRAKHFPSSGVASSAPYAVLLKFRSICLANLSGSLLMLCLSITSQCGASDLSGEAAVVNKAEGTANRKLALSILENYLVSHPDSASAYLNAARMSNAVGNHHKTVALATSYLNLKPDPLDYYAYHLRAQAYTCLGQCDKALADLDIARRAQPANSEVAVLTGAANLKMGRYQQALQDFSQAAKLKDPGGYRLRADAELDHNDIRGAAADFVKYAHYTDDIAGILAHADQLSKRDKYDEAVVILDELLKSNLPKFERQILELKANILYRGHRNKEALTTCDLYEKKFNRTDLYTVKYWITWANRDYAAALVCSNGMLKLRPHERQLFILRGDCYYALDEFAKALADYNRVSDLVMKDPQKRRTRAECNYQLGNFQAAANELEGVNSAEPTAVGYERQAQCLRSLNRYKDAVVYFSRAITMTPLKSTYFGERGDCYRRLKDYTHALKDFSDAMALNPENMVYVFGRGMCFSELGRNDEAIKDFTTAMSNPHLMSRACLERAKLYDKIGEPVKAANDRRAAEHDGKSFETDLFR